MSPSDVSTPLWRRFTGESKRSLEETRTFYEIIGQQYRSKIWSKPDALQRTSTAATRIIQEEIDVPPYPPFLDALNTYQHQLLALETQIFGPIEADLSQPVSLRAQMELNTLLRERAFFYEHEDEVCDLIVAAFRDTAEILTNALPPPTQSGFATPLISHIANTAEVVEAILQLFLRSEHLEAKIFKSLNDALYSNLCKATGVSPEAELKKPLILPTAADLPASELVKTYLSGTPLSDLFSVPYPFELPEEQRFAGHWIVAPAGRGKTTLLHALVHEDLSKDAAIVLIDSKGDLIEPIKKLQSIKDRLLLIEPDPDSAFALNPLDVSHASVVQVVSLIEYIMAGLLDAKFTALQSTLFRNVVPAIIEATPNPTLDDFKRVMVKGLPALDKVNPHARNFFENRETGFHSKTYESTRKEVVWRLDYLMSNPTLRSMFSATHTKLDVGKEMDAGKVIIINNSKAILGDEGAEFFGRFFVALIARAAQQRAGKPASSKKPCYVYVDECQAVIAKDTRIPVLLDECRSQKIALILSHQRTAQLTVPVLDAIANCAIRMANSDDEARYLSDKLRMTTDELRSLPRGTFGTFVRDLTSSGVQLKVSKIDLDFLPKMTEEELAVLRERMRSDFSSRSRNPQVRDSSGAAAGRSGSASATARAGRSRRTCSRVGLEKKINIFARTSCSAVPHHRPLQIIVSVYRNFDLTYCGRHGRNTRH